MSKYSDFLRSQGATDEDVKLLDTPLAQRAFDAQQAAADASVMAYKQKADDWYEKTIKPNYEKMEQESIAAKAEVARATSLIQQSQDEGLKRVAAGMGFKTPDPTAPPTASAPSFDPAKYVSVDTLRTLQDNVGEGLAALEDMRWEHTQLFPDKQISVRELRREAVAAGKNIVDYWETKFGVPAARAARAAADKKVYEDRLIEQGRTQGIAEMANQYGNPNMVPASASTNVFAPRPKSNREKQPWESGLDGENGSPDRVTRATKSFVERQGQAGGTGPGYGRTN